MKNKKLETQNKEVGNSLISYSCSLFLISYFSTPMGGIVSKGISAHNATQSLSHHTNALQGDCAEKKLKNAGYHFCVAMEDTIGTAWAV